MDAKRADRVSLVVVVFTEILLPRYRSCYFDVIDVSTRSAGFRGGAVGHTGRDKTGLHRDPSRGEVKEELRVRDPRGIERDPPIDALKIRDTFSRPNDAAPP